MLENIISDIGNAVNSCVDNVISTVAINLLEGLSIITRLFILYNIFKMMMLTDKKDRTKTDSMYLCSLGVYFLLKVLVGALN